MLNTAERDLMFAVYLDEDLDVVRFRCENGERCTGCQEKLHFKNTVVFCDCSGEINAVVCARCAQVVHLRYQALQQLYVTYDGHNGRDVHDYRQTEGSNDR